MGAPAPALSLLSLSLSLSLSPTHPHTQMCHEHPGAEFGGDCNVRMGGAACFALSHAQIAPLVHSLFKYFFCLVEQPVACRVSLLVYSLYLEVSVSRCALNAKDWDRDRRRVCVV